MELHLEVRRFRVLTYPEEPELADSWAAGVARDENQKQQTTTKSQSHLGTKGKVMKQSVNSLPMATAAKRPGFRSLGVLLVIALLWPLAAAQAEKAETWSFKLVNAPIALNSFSPTFESIRLSGGGTFDPALRAVAASGTFTLFNAFDHPNGPIVHGTWHSTGFVSFMSVDDDDEDDGPRNAVLTISIQTVDADGGFTGPGEMTLMNNGIQGRIYAGEPFTVPPGGSGGRTQFKRNGPQPFYPPVP